MLDKITSNMNIAKKELRSALIGMLGLYEAKENKNCKPNDLGEIEKDSYHIFEKMYFHELEYREKIISRLQMTFAIIIAIASVIGAIGQKINIADVFEPSIISLSLASSILSLLLATLFFFLGLFRHEYKLMPSAVQCSLYIEQLRQTYSPYEDSEELTHKYFRQFLRNGYAEWSSHNMAINDTRTKHIYKANLFVIIAVAASLVFYVSYKFSGLDDAGKKQTINVNISSVPKIGVVPVMIANQSSSSSRPPPPPPPEPRLIRESAEDKIKQPPPKER